jgi:hypothetical protein
MSIALRAEIIRKPPRRKKCPFDWKFRMLHIGLLSFFRGLGDRMTERDRRLAMKKLSWILLTLLLLAGCRFEDRVPIDMASMSQSQPLRQEQSLDSAILFDIGSLEITSSRKNTALYSFDLDYDKASYQPEVQYNSGAEGRFSFDLHSTNKRGLRRQRQSNRLRLEFTDSIPLSLKVNADLPY